MDLIREKLDVCSQITNHCEYAEKNDLLDIVEKLDVVHQALNLLNPKTEKVLKKYPLPKQNAQRLDIDSSKQEEILETTTFEILEVPGLDQLEICTINTQKQNKSPTRTVRDSSKKKSTVELTDHVMITESTKNVITPKGGATETLMIGEAIEVESTETTVTTEPTKNVMISGQMESGTMENVPTEILKINCTTEALIK